MGSMFSPAMRKRKKLRLLLAGPTDSGKTRTALRFAFGIVAHELRLRGEARAPRIWGIDTEHGRMSFYKNLADDGIPYVFQVCELESFAPQTAVSALRECWSAGLDAVVMDSLSHFWGGSGGVLEQHKAFTDKRKDHNSYAAWQEAGAVQNQFIEALLKSPMHVIATCRQKMDAVQERDETTGKTVIKSIGLQDEQRDTLRYEFDVIANISQDHELTIVKTPWDAMERGPVCKAGAAFILPLVDWLNEGEGDFDKPEFPALSPDMAAAIAEREKPASKKEQLAAAVAATVPSVTAATSSSLILATDLQVSEITIACQTLALAGQPAAMLAKRGVSRLEDLTRAQADEILGTLRAKVKEKKIELDKQLAAAEKEKPANPTTVSTPTAPQSSAAGPASAPHSPATVGVEPGVIPERSDRVGSILPDDEKRISAYCHKLMIGDADLARILAKRMQGNPPHPTRCVADLTYTHSQEILSNLKAALQKRFPDQAPF